MNSVKGTLYMVATPIGNLDDMTPRAVATLNLVDAVFAEDTRVSAKLLFHFKIEKPLYRYDEHSHESASKKIESLLDEGKSIALMTDAGTPGIADPGSRLVASLIKKDPNTMIVPIPGASAVIALLSVSGESAESFTFLGYPPHKKGRKTFFESLREEKTWPVIVYESPHRIRKTLESLQDVFGDETRLTIGRELTKKFEEVWRGTPRDALEYFVESKVKGEFVMVINRN